MTDLETPPGLDLRRRAERAANVAWWACCVGFVLMACLMVATGIVLILR